LRLKGLIWVEEIVEELAEKHNVSQDEVREILTHDPHFQFVEKGIGRARMCTRPWGRARPADT
jgi:NADH:ubiquinone oxidoreductase subunit E